MRRSTGRADVIGLRKCLKMSASSPGKGSQHGARCVAAAVLHPRERGAALWDQPGDPLRDGDLAPRPLLAHPQPRQRLWRRPAAARLHFQCVCVLAALLCNLLMCCRTGCPAVVCRQHSHSFLYAVHCTRLSQTSSGILIWPTIYCLQCSHCSYGL